MLWTVVLPMAVAVPTRPSVTDWLTAVGAIGTLIVAFVAAIAAFGQLGEARRLREAQAQPFVVVDVEPSVVTRKILNLVIRNTGQTLARNVTIEFDPVLQSTMDSTGYPITNVGPLKNGIPALPPGREYQIMLDSTIERFHSDLPDKYSVIVGFNDRDGKKMDDLTYDVDLALYRGALYVQERGIDDVVEELIEFRTTFARWANMTEDLHARRQSASSSPSVRRSQIQNRASRQDPPRWVRRPRF